MAAPLLNAALLLLPLPQDVEVEVHNAAHIERGAIVAATVPFARGVLVPPAEPGSGLLAVDVLTPGNEGPAPAVAAAGLPLLTWPDGSIAALQVHFRAEVAAQGRRRVTVRPRRAAADAPAEPQGRALWCELAPHRSLLRQPLPLWTEVVDAWGRTFRADLVPDAAAGPDGLLSDTGLVRTRRFRSAHRAVAAPDQGRPLFDLRAYLTTYDGERRAELVLVLDNQEPEAGPLGPLRLQSFCVCTSADDLRLLPAFAVENVLPLAERQPGGGYRQWLLPPRATHYLGDGTAKAVRLWLFQDGEGVDEAQRAEARWGGVPMAAFAALPAVRQSRAFGAHGGPAPLDPGDTGDATRQLLLWRQIARFGPFGGFGDPEDSALDGAPRHGDSLLHNVLRWQSPPLLAAADAMVLQHALRPTGGRAARLPADTAAWRAGLPAAAFERPHGFSPFDYEHCSAHLVYDYWWLTGDPFARDELRRLGGAVRAMLPAVPFRTSRGEGNCIEAGVLCARATGDQALLAWLLDHALQRIEPAMAEAGSAAALAQPPHPLVLDGKTPFDAPSQMAALVRGLAALHAATGDARLLTAVARVADAMAGPAWLEGEGPKTFVSGADPGRYSLAVLPEDRSGSDRMTIGAFVLAAELVGDPEARDLLRSRAAHLLDRECPVDAGPPVRWPAAANPWLQVGLDRRDSH